MPTAVKKWPTPKARDYKGAGRTAKLRDSLDYAVERSATKSKAYAAKDQTSTGKLNPTWVAWLMGWPHCADWDWTSLDAAPADALDTMRDCWREEPADIPRVDTDIPQRAKRLKALGNGQVPQTAAMAFEILKARLEQL